MASSWTLTIDQEDLARTALLEQAVPEVGGRVYGEVLAGRTAPRIGHILTF